MNQISARLTWIYCNTNYGASVWSSSPTRNQRGERVESAVSDGGGFGSHAKNMHQTAADTSMQAMQPPLLVEM